MCKSCSSEKRLNVLRHSQESALPKLYSCIFSCPRFGAWREKSKYSIYLRMLISRPVWLNHVAHMRLRRRDVWQYLFEDVFRIRPIHFRSHHVVRFTSMKTIQLCSRANGSIGLFSDQSNSPSFNHPRRSTKALPFAVGLRADFTARCSCLHYRHHTSCMSRRGKIQI